MMKSPSILGKSFTQLITLLVAFIVISFFNGRSTNNLLVSQNSNGFSIKGKEPLNFGASIKQSREYLEENYQTFTSEDKIVDSYFSDKLILGFTTEDTFNYVSIDSSVPEKKDLKVLVLYLISV